MNTRHLLIAQYTAILVFSALYAPQPLLPVLADAFAVSESRAASLITVSLLPLAVAMIREVLHEAVFLRLYRVVFPAFGSFALVLNFLPFRLVELGTDLNETGIALMYSGYLMGVVTSLIPLRIARRIGGLVNTMMLGPAVFVAALRFFAGSAFWLLFVGMFVMCAEMFLIHSTGKGTCSGPQSRNLRTKNACPARHRACVPRTTAPSILGQSLLWPKTSR